MSERYGEVPKKFSKAWWEYFWEYYKWYVIAPLVIAIAIGSTIYTKLTEPKYDITLTYAANNFISDESDEVLSAELSKLCEDVDGNGESALFLSQLWIRSNPSQEDMEYARASATKLQLSFAGDEKYVYILDKEVADLFVGESEDICPYAPLEAWFKDIPEGANVYSAHGKNYGISLEGNKILEGHGIDLENHFVFMRYYPRQDQLKKQLVGYEAAANFAKALISQK